MIFIDMTWTLVTCIVKAPAEMKIKLQHWTSIRARQRQPQSQNIWGKRLKDKEEWLAKVYGDSDETPKGELVNSDGEETKLGWLKRIAKGSGSVRKKVSVSK